MHSAHQSRPAQLVDSLIGWWRLAGVEEAAGEVPADWLTPPRAHREVPAAAPVASGGPLAAVGAALPDSLDAFQAWLAAGDGLIEQGWTGPSIPPAGPGGAVLMVIADMPEPDAQSPGGYLTDEAGTLLDAMLAALGLKREDCYLAALAVRRAPGGVLPPGTLAPLAARMRHHIALVAPRGILLLGDGPSRALFSTEAPVPYPNLPSINHVGGKIPAIMSIHPRLLLKQPSAKAGCWRAMQLLNGAWQG